MCSKDYSSRFGYLSTFVLELQVVSQLLGDIVLTASALQEHEQYCANCDKNRFT